MLHGSMSIMIRSVKNMNMKYSQGINCVHSTWEVNSGSQCNLYSDTNYKDYIWIELCGASAATDLHLRVVIVALSRFAV